MDLDVNSSRLAAAGLRVHAAHEAAQAARVGGALSAMATALPGAVAPSAADSAGRALDESLAAWRALVAQHAQALSSSGELFRTGDDADAAAMRRAAAAGSAGDTGAAPTQSVPYVPLLPPPAKGMQSTPTPVIHPSGLRL